VQPAAGRAANDRGDAARLPQRRFHPVGRTGAGARRGSSSGQGLIAA
jgi:hypothetical protein